MNPIIRGEQTMTVLGVEGRYFGATKGEKTAPGCFTHQRWSASRPCQAFHPKGMLKVEIRFDDECGNRHNTFAITADATHPGGRDIDAGGCLHEEIAAVFPELAGLIKWHLCSSDGPMHYLANTLYHAGGQDCWGLRKGEVRQLRNRKSGLLAWKLVTVDQDGTECEPGPTYEYSETRPAGSWRLEYRPWNRVGEGKERDLDAARSCAIWPEATDEQLAAPDLKDQLIARQPDLLSEFRAMVESLGFSWEAGR